MKLGWMLVLAGLVACGPSAPPEPEKPACDVSIDTLEGKSFVWLETQLNGAVAPNPRARMKFEKEGDTLKMKYTMMSIVEVYDYECQKLKEDEYLCTTPVRLKELCLAMELDKEGSCSLESIQGVKGVYSEAADIEKAIKETKKVYAEAKAGPNFETFKNTNYGIANQLQALMYVRVDERRCRLKVDDMYMTFYQGKRREDHNMVGQASFMKSPTEYGYVSCARENQKLLADSKSEVRPESKAEFTEGNIHALGEPVHYFYVDKDDSTKAGEGCTYTADLYAGYQPVAKDQAISVTEDGFIDWHVSHTYTAEQLVKVGKNGQGIFHMVRKQTCGGETKDINVVCNATIVQ